MANEKPPRKFKLHFNFITLHYCYMIGAIILLSIIIYPARNMAYIDALFFASGACTQSGLNTIDVNTLELYQQIFIYLFPMITTPIFINFCVVRVRLHWFEKRFQNIVEMSRLPSRARTLTQDRRRDNLNALERGVRGRSIRVIHNDSELGGVEGSGGIASQQTSSTAVSSEGIATRQTSSTAVSSEGKGLEKVRSRSPGASSTTTTTMSEPQTVEQVQDNLPTNTGGNVQFTDLLTPHLPSPRLPSPRQPSSPRMSSARLGLSDDGSDDNWNSANNAHIAFVGGRQLLPNEKALRIPGPRDFEKGDQVMEVDDDDTYALAQAKTGEDTTRPTRPSRSYSFSHAATNASMRLRKLPTVDRILPPTTTALSTAFSMGTAKRRKSFSTLQPKQPKPAPPMPYLSYKPMVGRNSQFVDLNEEQREELGGIEYRSLKLLGRILLVYYIFFHVFGILSIVPWIYTAPPEYREYLHSVGLNPAWWAIFSAQTSFNNVGFTLTPDSMLTFYKCTWIIIAMAFLIVIGNTGFPCLLRFLIWAFFKLAPECSAIKEALNFLLDHPRRCFTLLFPSRETWVLFWVLVGLNLADVILFIVLDLKNPEIVKIAVGHRVLDAIFQAVSTRTAGLVVVNLAALHPAVQVSYMIMMYISVFPIAISVRRTNVYEEKSLGVYPADDEEDDGTGASYVGLHLKKQLSFDLWYIFLGLFIICIAEGGHLENTNDYAFTIFSVLFEIVSAYGTVGLSLGYPGLNASFSAKFNTVSKLVIIAMQIRGRHRGLPYELDRAVLLPKDQRDVELSSIRRRNSNISMAHPFPHTSSRPVTSQAVDN